MQANNTRQAKQFSLTKRTRGRRAGLLSGLDDETVRGRVRPRLTAHCSLLTFVLLLLTVHSSLLTEARAQTIVDKMVASVNNGARANPDLITYSDLIWQLALEPDHPFTGRPSSEDLNHALRLREDQL